MSIKIIVAMLIVNMVSYVIGQAVFLRRKHGAKIREIGGWVFRQSRSYSGGDSSGDETRPTVNMLIPGMEAFAETAYGFMLETMDNYLVTVNYSLLGFNPREMTNEIIEWIDEYQEKAGETAMPIRIFAISLSEMVARRVKQVFGADVEIYLINPSTCLKKSAKVKTTLGAIILKILALLLGWLSLVPMIPATGGKYPLQLLADQCLALAKQRDSEEYSDRIEGMILSLRDQYVDNETTLWRFPWVPVVEIATRHGDTVGKAEKYRYGVEELGRRLERRLIPERPDPEDEYTEWIRREVPREQSEEPMLNFPV